MQNIFKLSVLILISQLAGAVTIGFSYDVDCTLLLAFCTNILGRICCIAPGQPNSVQFTQIASSPGIFGTAYDNQNNGGVCEDTCGTTFGTQDPQCINCGNFISGAAWQFIPTPTIVPRADGEDCTPVLVDKVNIDGRVFEVNFDVPAEATADLVGLARNGTKYGDVPEGLLQYEAAGLTLESLLKL